MEDAKSPPWKAFKILLVSIGAVVCGVAMCWRGEAVQSGNSHEARSLYALPDEKDKDSSSPTHKPTHKPSHKPTHRPTHKPTHKPTQKPTDTSSFVSGKPSHKPTHSPTPSGSSQPNIIFILSDDLPWNALGYNGYESSFASPFLTGLAQDGIIIENYYAQEMCTPSRGSFLTGRYPLSIGLQYGLVRDTESFGLNLNETTIAEALHENGYSTYMLGKWHLGHSSSRHLPTARGFDMSLSYFSGSSYYWSKRVPDHSQFKDMVIADSECYYSYEGDDLHYYSTHFYRDKAIDIIDSHDASTPMFMYLAFQAVHDPFSDDEKYSSGIPASYVSDEIYNNVIANITGRKQRQLTMALNVLDSAVSDIYDALDDKGMLDNTCIIFASDNGGCYKSGGKNGPLRGTKGTLFEGGVRVDAFVYASSSSLLPKSKRGSTYSGLFHVSDWFPTIMNMTGSYFVADDGYALDGFDQWSSMAYDDDDDDDDDDGGGVSTPRDYVLYNYYVNVDDYTFSLYDSGGAAIRNSQYKLLHTYDSAKYGAWYTQDDLVDDDDIITTAGGCDTSNIVDSGTTYTYFLFDLINDPYETTNLYDTGDDDSNVADAKTELYAQLEIYLGNAATCPTSGVDMISKEVWESNGNYLTPWVTSSSLEKSRKTYGVDTYPSYCGAYTDTTMSSLMPKR